ncbi:F-box protein CPR1-like [Hevea brasiliensis]|uniref:F-box protein CPR1-like n=1 Tax=Hevea brasiliensis TaxID=3981 RepID=UPI0025DF6736|nr:F-box protein CPR1-like [Hevea brasiliensis]
MPDEVMAEILFRLSIKTLLQCTSVCKSRYALIKNPNFISTHLHKALSSRDNRLFFHHSYSFCDDDKYCLRFDDKDFKEYVTLYPSFDTKKPLHVACSCNGVICLFSDDFSYGGCRFILWNPFIRKSLLLPLPHLIFANVRNRCKNFIGFGFDSRTHDYKVLRIMNPPVEDGIHIRTELYSLNSNSWKNITEITLKIGWEKKHKHGRFIMVFDARDEVFREILLQECFVND